MVDNEINITTLGYQEIAGRTRAPQSGTIIINVIHKDISAARTVALLNRLRMYLTHCNAARSDCKKRPRQLMS